MLSNLQNVMPKKRKYMKITILLFALLVFLTIQNLAQTVTDIDGNVYNTVNIGTQIWMKENLKVTHYNTGDSILHVSINNQWGQAIGVYCNYNNDTNNANVYGRLYNWYAVKDFRGICPENWHIPSDAEWTILTNFLGGDSVSGGKLKEIGNNHWNSPNTGATDEVGFTALPGGYRIFWGDYYFLGEEGYWWSSTDSSTYAWKRELMYNSTNVNRWYYNKLTGFSVRCICDSAASPVNEINNKNKFRIYPNPANDKLTIDITDKQDLNLSIYNIIGELVLQREIINNRNEVDISSLSAGMYIIRITSSSLTVQHKMIKE